MMDFAPVDEARWRELLAKELKGAPSRGFALDCGEVIPPLPPPGHTPPVLTERPRMALVGDPGPCLDAGFVHDAGGDEVQDLGLLLSLGLDALAAGNAPDELLFSLRLGTQPLVEIARIRALRLAWARVLELCGLPVAEARVHARLGDRVLCRYAPWNNALRHTAATFAAAVAGVDCYTPVSHDGSEEGLRVATNAVRVALEEAQLGRTRDPAAGSAAIEALTAVLARRAWEEMQRIRAEGLDALAGRVEATHDRRVERIRTRKLVLVGVSDFVDIDEPTPPAAPPASGGRFPLRRLAAPFEALRDAPVRAGVSLVAVGSLAELGARLTWTRGLLQAGGFRPPEPSPLGADAALAAFRANPTPIAVICATDAHYPELVPQLAPALLASGARKVLLAGRPGPAQAAFVAAGVHAFAFVGMDVVAFLEDLLAVKP